MREVFLNLKDEAQSTQIFRDAYKKVRNCITQYEKGKFKSETNNKPGGKQISGGGRKVVCANACKGLFAFFIDIRFALKARLPYSILIAQAKLLYAEYYESKEKMGKHRNYYALAESG